MVLPIVESEPEETRYEWIDTSKCYVFALPSVNNGPVRSNAVDITSPHSSRRTNPIECTLLAGYS